MGDIVSLSICADSETGRKGPIAAARRNRRSDATGRPEIIPAVHCHGPQPIPFSSPGAPFTAVIAFYNPGRPAACDRFCNAAYLGNFHFLRKPLELTLPNGEAQRFHTAEGGLKASHLY